MIPSAQMESNLREVVRVLLALDATHASAGVGTAEVVAQLAWSKSRVRRVLDAGASLRLLQLRRRLHTTESPACGALRHDWSVTPFGRRWLRILEEER